MEERNVNQVEFEDNKYHVVKTEKKLIEAQKTTIDKVQWLIRDYSQGKGDSLKDFIAYVDERVMVTFARRIMNGGVNLPDKTDNYGNITLYAEQKIHGHKEDKETGLCPVISIKFVKNGPSMRIPYKITIEHGTGKANRGENGRITIASGTYKKTQDCSMMLSQMDFETFFSEILVHYQAKKSAEETVKLFQEMKKK